MDSFVKFPLQNGQMSIFTPTFGELSILHIPLDDNQNNLVKDLVKDHIPNRFWCTNLAHFFGDGESPEICIQKKDGNDGIRVQIE